MSLTSIPYLLLVFFAVIVYYLVSQRMQPWVLLAVSLFFYSTFDLRYFIFLGFSILTSYFITIQMQREEEKGKKRRLTLVTGEGAYPFLNRLLDELREKCDNYKIRVIPVKNDFFGGTVNVAGLLTGQDIERCLQREDLGECVLLPGVTLRQQEDVFLADMSLQQLAGRLGVPVIPVPNSGYALLDAIIGRNEEIG